MLDQSAADPRGRAVQWRQLVELVASGSGEASPALIDRALARIAGVMAELPVEVLAATSRAIAGPSVPAELIALFAAKGAEAVRPLIDAAQLDFAGWSAVLAGAAPDVLPLLEGRTGSRPAPKAAPPAAARPAAPPPAAPAAPTPLPPGLFRWECGPTGEIDWVEGAPRAALIGRNLAERFADRFAARLPITEEPVVLAREGELAGEWQWSGLPAFFPDTGRFAGYRGIARRGPAPAEADPLAATATTLLTSPIPEDNALRELMHELRTPLNAIIGFGEIIEGQYLGPAHRAYRERAGEIVRQARLLADAVDNLDLAARQRSGRVQGPAETELESVRTLAAALAEEAGERQVRVTVEDRAGTGRLALQPALSERLTRQFAGVILGAAAPKEKLTLTLEPTDGRLAIAVERPAALRGLSDAQLFEANAAGPGSRFTLRLVQSLAAMIGGALDMTEDRARLLLPLAE